MYLLSIVIPTKNRPDTAIYTITTAINLNSDDVEIVVQDCSNVPILYELINEKGYASRVCYFHDTETVSMTENWNRAMKNAHGEYVIVIGDDDGIDLNILRVVNWAHENNIDAICAKNDSFYWYCDFPDPDKACLLAMPYFTANVTICDSTQMLNQCAETGDEYSRLPQAYRNVIRRSVFENIYKHTGKYFDSLSPDIYAAYAISCEVDKFYIIDYPMSLIGACAKSNTARVVTKQLHQHMEEFTDFEYSWLAPESHEYVASNTDCMFRAFNNYGRLELIRKINIARVYARTIVDEPFRLFEHTKKYIKVCKRLQKPVIPSVLVMFVGIIAKYVLLLISYLRSDTENVSASRKCCKDVGSIVDAVSIQNEWLNEQGLKFPSNKSDS